MNLLIKGGKTMKKLLKKAGRFENTIEAYELLAVCRCRCICKCACQQGSNASTRSAGRDEDKSSYLSSAKYS